MNNDKKMAKKDTDKSMQSNESEDQVDHILKLLESLPHEAQAKAFEELKNRLNLNKSTAESVQKPKDEAEVIADPEKNKNQSTRTATVIKTRKRSRKAESASNANNNATIAPNPLLQQDAEEILPHSPVSLVKENEIEESEYFVENQSINDESKRSQTQTRIKPKRKHFSPRKVVSSETPLVKNGLDEKLINGCFVHLQKLDVFRPLIAVLENKKPKRKRKKPSVFENFVNYDDPDYVECEAVITETAGETTKLRKKRKCQDPDKPKYYCEECNIQYKSYNGYVSHQFSHTGESRYTCMYCDKKFSLKHALEIHVRRHENDKPFRCSFCEYRGVAKVDVLKHMAIHTGKKDYVCEICGKAFVNQSRLNTHTKTVHATDNVCCEICGYLAKSKSYLERHNIAVHTDREVFECPICHRIIQQKSIFKLHLEKHTGVTPFSCNICGKKFPNKSRLNLHVKTHDEPTIPCDFCDKKFKTLNHLRRHAIIHTNDKPFSCHICGYSCNVTGNLVKHVRLVHQIFDFNIRKNSANHVIFPEKDEKVNEEVLLEKGMNILDEVLKKTSSLAGKEFTIEELKEIETRQMGQKLVNDHKSFDMFRFPKRKRGRPKKEVLIDPEATRLAEEVKIKSGLPTNQIKVVQSLPMKDCGKKKKNNRDLQVDLNQYVFEVQDDDGVDVPIEQEEEGKKLRMYVIEVSNDTDEKDIGQVFANPSAPELLVIDENGVVKTTADPNETANATEVLSNTGLSIRIV